MRALIFEQPGALGVGALDLAGRPLLVRQLQWLRSQGIEEVVVEVVNDETAVERAELLLGVDPLTTQCQVIPTRAPIGVVELADRAGIEQDALFLALPADLIVQAELTPCETLTTYVLAAPPFAAQQAAVRLALRTRGTEAAQPTLLERGWALRVHDLATVHAISCAALSSRDHGLLVHAAELRPGIWLARGARVSEDATLVAPVLIGTDARVFAGAHLGPNVVIGRRAVVEREAVLSDAIVSPGTLVGEGMRIHRAQVDPWGSTSLSDYTRDERAGPLELASAVEQGPLPTSRVVAALLLALLSVPWLLAFAGAALVGRVAVRRLWFGGRALHVGTLGLGAIDLLPALLDVVLGRRDLVGVSQPAALDLEAKRKAPPRPGALDISAQLAPDASTSTLLSMWRWYQRNKSAALDRQLWLGPLFGARARKSRSRRP